MLDRWDLKTCKAPNRCVLRLESRLWHEQGATAVYREEMETEENQDEDVVRLSALSYLYVHKKELSVIVFGKPQSGTHPVDNTSGSGLIGFAWTHTREGNHDGPSF